MIVWVTLIIALSALAVAHLAFRAWVQVESLHVQGQKSAEDAVKAAEDAKAVTNQNTQTVLDKIQAVERRVGTLEMGSAVTTRTRR